jgi:hypothetical protein
MTQAITPTSGANLLHVRAQGHFGNATGAGGIYCTMALFQDATAGALAPSVSLSVAQMPPALRKSTISRSAYNLFSSRPTTFRIRAGGTTGTMTFNGVMPRSATTALYTRVDNSFSNPVVGTTISPTDADTFFDDVESAVNAFVATSASSVAIGTGAKTFTVAADVAGKSFLAGTFVHIYSRSDTADFMFGTVTSYSTSTGALVVDVTATGGSGTDADWNIVSSRRAGRHGRDRGHGCHGRCRGILQTYSSTTADADPGAGVFRLNNATPASATAAYLDNLDSGGATVSTIFDLWDDSTTTTRGLFVSRRPPIPPFGRCSPSRARWLMAPAIASSRSAAGRAAAHSPRRHVCDLVLSLRRQGRGWHDCGLYRGHR